MRSLPCQLVLLLALTLHGAVGQAAEASAAAGAATRPVAGSPAAEIKPYDEHYGVYVSGQKTGWMRARLWLLPQPVLSTELHAKVSGMGQVSDIELIEERTYAAQSNFSSGILAVSFALIAA